MINHNPKVSKSTWAILVSRLGGVISPKGDDVVAPFRSTGFNFYDNDALNFSCSCSKWSLSNLNRRDHQAQHSKSGWLSNEENLQNDGQMYLSLITSWQWYMRVSSIDRVCIAIVYNVRMASSFWPSGNHNDFLSSIPISFLETWIPFIYYNIKNKTWYSKQRATKPFVFSYLQKQEDTRILIARDLSTSECAIFLLIFGR